MAFHFAQKQAIRFLNVDLLHQMGCKLCPLYTLKQNKHKDIQPYGYEGPGGIYVLGLGPGIEEDRAGKFFVGPSGDFLKSHFDEFQIQYLRFSNVVRTRPPKDDPAFEAIEACRPSVEKDLMQTRPKLVFLLGGVPLQWALRAKKAPSINAWRGHRFPFRVGDHNMWGWPIFHPAHILREQDTKKKKQLTEIFQLDIANAYKFMDRNLVPEVQDPAHALDNCRIVINPDEIKKELVRFYKDPYIVIDLETHDDKHTGKPYAPGAKILSISIGNKDRSIAFPWMHPQAKWHGPEFQSLREFFHKFIRNVKQVKKAHNASFEQEWLVCEYDDPQIVRANWHDTMSPSYVLGLGGNVKEPAEGGRAERLFKGLLSLDNLCMVYYGFFLKSLSPVDRVNLIDEDLEEVLKYNAGDTLWTDRIDQKLMADVRYSTLDSISAEHDRRVPTMVLTQWKGLTPDIERAKAHSARIGKDIIDIYTKVNNDPAVLEYRTKYRDFNISAPADVAYLFKYLGYKVTYEDPRTHQEKVSSNDQILQAIDHPLSKLILNYRELTKLKSTYVDIFLPGPDSNVYPDGLVHGTFTTFFTTTGRTSSENPNLQNFPKRRNKEIRNIIVAPPGYVFASCDFGQIEYRVLVMASKDPTLIDFVWNGQDIHAEWALKIVKAYPRKVGEAVANRWLSADPATLKDVDPLFGKFRNMVKNAFVFASFYGAGIPKLAQGLGIDKSIVRDLYDEFWEEFHVVKDWHRWAYDFYAANGYIETLTGRRRYAPIQAGEIINAPIQGGASDIVIDGMNRLSEYALESGKMQFQPVINIHDDLSFYLPEQSWEEDLRYIINAMLDCKFPFINVPLQVEASVGPDWFTQKPYGIFDNATELRARLTQTTN